MQFKNNFSYQKKRFFLRIFFIASFMIACIILKEGQLKKANISSNERVTIKRNDEQKKEILNQGEEANVSKIEQKSNWFKPLQKSQEPLPKLTIDTIPKWLIKQSTNTNKVFASKAAAISWKNQQKQDPTSPWYQSEGYIIMQVTLPNYDCSEAPWVINF